MTFREVCSDIINDLKSYNLDDRLSYRFVIHKLSDSASVFLKQDAEYRRLFKIGDLWRTISCIELEDASLSECDCNIYQCKTIKKSIKRLPDTYESSYGNILKLLNIDNSKEYIEIKPQEYRTLISRKYQPKSIGYYWEEDGFIFLPDTDVEVIKGIGIFKNSIEVEIFNGVKNAECKSYLDAEWNFPQYISKLAKDNIVEQLAGVNKRIPEDNIPDLNTNNK